MRTLQERFPHETYPVDGSEIICEIIYSMKQKNWTKAMALRDKYQRLHCDNPDAAWRYNPLEVERIISIVEREYFLRYGS